MEGNKKMERKEEKIEARSFIKPYFDNKSLEDLKKTIIPKWTDTNLNTHLNLVSCPKQATHIMEIGCGIGRLIKSLNDENTDRFFLGIDTSKGMLYEAEKYLKDVNVELILSDGTDVDALQGMNMDFIYSIITFQHIPNINTVKNYLTMAYNNLKDGGELSFQVLNKEMNKGFLWNYHPLEELDRHLVSLGFKCIGIELFNDWAIFHATKLEDICKQSKHL